MEGWWACVSQWDVFAYVKASAGVIGPGPITLSPRPRPIGWSPRSPDLSPHSIGPEHGWVPGPSSGWRPQWSALVLARCHSGQRNGQLDPQPARPLRLTMGGWWGCYESGAWEHPWISELRLSLPGLPGIALGCSVYPRGGSWPGIEDRDVGNQTQGGWGEC